MEGVTKPGDEPGFCFFSRNKNAPDVKDQRHDAAGHTNKKINATMQDKDASEYLQEAKVCL